MASTTNTVETRTASGLLAPFLKAATAPIETVRACYSDSTLEFSDFALNKMNMNRDAAVVFMKETFEEFSVTAYHPASTHSTRDICTLEGTYHLKANRDTPLGKKGDAVKISRVSPLKFDQDGKIVMQHDYYCIPIAY